MIPPPADVGFRISDFGLDNPQFAIHNPQVEQVRA